MKLADIILGIYSIILKIYTYFCAYALSSVSRSTELYLNKDECICNPCHSMSNMCSHRGCNSHLQCQVLATTGDQNNNSAMVGVSAETREPHVIGCKWKDVAPIPTTPLAGHLLQQFKKHGDKTAMICGLSGSRMTYTDITDWVLRMSYGLNQNGIKEGDVVCMVTPNVLLAPLTFISAIAANATVTFANPTYSLDELRHHLINSGSRWLIVHPLVVPLVRAAVKGIDDIQGVYILGETVIEEYEPITSLGKDPPAEWTGTGLGGDAVIHIPYSSGTTGLPKGVMLTSKNWHACLSSSGRYEFLNVDSSDVSLVILPIFHVFGLGVMLTSLSYGLTMVLLPKFQPESFLKALQEYKVTFAPLVPPLAVFLAKYEAVDKIDLSSLRNVPIGAAPLSKEIQDTLMERFPHMLVRQGYGMTEGTMCSICCDPKENIPGAIGHIVANTEAKVVDIESGTPLPHGQNGEICFRGALVMKGYLNNESATKSLIDDDGWLHTGDVGYYDENENFFIVDRMKELIKFKGFQVPPAELEGLLLRHEDIADVAVIGIKDDAAGELPKAFVVARPGKSIVPEDIANWIAEHVAPHKKLRGGVEVVSSIPKSASGKILRRKLREVANV